MRQNHTLILVSVISLTLNLIFLHHLSILERIEIQKSVERPTSKVNKCINSQDFFTKNENGYYNIRDPNAGINNKNEDDYEKQLEQLVSMQISERPTMLNHLTRLAEHYIKQKLIFILGSMSSGTTLMRLILDTHPEINCGDETKIIELMLTFVENTKHNQTLVAFMQNSSVSNITIEKATALFTYFIMENNFKSRNLSLLHPVKYLCNKEPMNTHRIYYIHCIFPRARFLYLIRDGRDMAYSYMRRNGMRMQFHQFLRTIVNWNKANKRSIDRCLEIGPEQCLIVKYESIVNEPETTIRLITHFLGVEFNEDMLRHDEFLNSEKLSLTKVRFINKGVQRKRINNGSVGQWRNKILGYDEDVIAKEITLLKQFNYI